MKKSIIVTLILVGLFFASSALADLNQGLIAYYSFDGNANDSYNNNGIVFGNISYLDGPVAKALHVESDGSYVEIGANEIINLNTPYKSISVWFKAEDMLNRRNMIFDKTSGSDYLLGIDKHDNNYVLAFEVRDDSHQSPVGIYTSISLFNWYNVIATKENNIITLYLNGNNVGSMEITNAVTRNNSLIVGAGGSPYVTGYQFNGEIDELRFYDRVLSESEIQEIVSQSRWDKILEWWYIQHRELEDGSNFNMSSFAMKDRNNNYILEDVLSSIELYDPEDTKVQLTVNEFGGTYKNISGGYDANNGWWYFGDLLNEESYYYVKFDETLKSGKYRLVVTDKSGTQYEGYKDFGSVKNVPIISSESFCAYKDNEDNLIWQWENPADMFSNVSTSIRTWIDVYNNEIPIGDIFIKVPTHMGWAFVPKNLLQKFENGNVIKIGLHVRTNDNNNRSYSKTINWEDANACKCDINGDQKTGLEEAIHALKVVSGMNR
ncbi:LamG domain-containing protein [Desulfobacterales bacterium HSG17]|nr:LamG domain-containing protein [Desulfobacterales bacterium HSG17]